MQILKYGLNYSIERPTSSYIADLIAETERAIRLLDVKPQNIPHYGNKQVKTYHQQKMAKLMY
jgi:hypothetical protein